MKNLSKPTACVAALTAALLALSGCSFSVTRTYDPGIGKQYLAAVCPVYPDLAKLATAQRSEDFTAFTTAAGTVRDDFTTQISALEHPALPWPAPIARQVHVLVVADSDAIHMFGAFAAATTNAQLQAVPAPDTSAAQKASDEIRAELGLPAKSAGGSC